jgi:Domain of unknown function (DUF6429)
MSGLGIVHSLGKIGGLATFSNHDRGVFTWSDELIYFVRPGHIPTELATQSATRLMNLDNEKIDQAVLALLYLGLHDEVRAWKGFDWEAMNRLHEKGWISNPRGKAKSVVFTEEGLIEARRLLEVLFSSEK